MTELKVVDKINSNKWDEFIKSHPDGNIFQTHQMMKVYENTINYEPLFLAVLDEVDEVQAIILACIIKEFDGILGSFTARSIIHGGPIYISGNTGLEAQEKLMETYDKIINKKAIYTEIRNMWHIPNNINFNGYNYENHQDIFIDLRKTEEELMKAIKRDKKRAIKKAIDNGINLIKIDNKDKIDYFYEILTETYNTVKVPLADKSKFKSVYDYLVLNGMADYFLAELDGKYIGGRLELYYKNRIYDWYAGASANSTTYYPNEFLVWHIIKWGSQNGFRSFDFGGAGKPDVEYGVRSFKERFGGEMVNFGRLIKIHQPIKKKISMMGFNIWRKIR